MGSTIDVLKELHTPTTPLFLIDCALSSGSTESWSTHAATFNGTSYIARLLKHTLFQLTTSSIDGFDGAAQISLTLANADSHFSEIERETGFKGAQVTIQFLFYDLVANTAASESRVVFRGIANAPDEITESSFRVTVMNRLNLQRIILPDTRIERTCPWSFPSSSAQRLTAVTGAVRGSYSALYKCGYSPDQTGGVGNLNSGAPFTSCDFTRTSCVQRGMFSTDSSSNITARFGGLEFVPAQILVRGYGEKGTQPSPLFDNLALYNDFVPLVYGTAWYMPPIVFLRNDGNLTRMEVLLGMGEISGVIQVLVNDIAIPEAQNGTNMTATGWYSLVTAGGQNGVFDPNFTDTSGNPLGDPYGSMAYLSVVVPNAISDGQSTPTIQVLLNGLLIEQFDSSGTSLGASFTNNPAWVLLDVLRRSGWLTTDVNLPSFAATATYCADAIATTDLYGNTTSTSRFKCNLVIQSRQSAAELAKSIRNASSLMLSYDTAGLLNLRVENTIALQQPTAPDGTNSTETLNGGWPSYEFSDGSASFSGLLRGSGGNPMIRLYSQNGISTTNQLTIEFQDEFNQYQQDSLTLVDIDDSQLTDRIVTAPFPGVGLPNFDQATRMLQLQLNKTIAGYTLVEFSTSVKGIGVSPGDLITVTYLKEGLSRQPFRVVKLAPGQDYQTVQITAQWHDDDWYTTGGANASGGGIYANNQGGAPRPLVASVLDTHGIEQFGITETALQSGDGSFTIQLSAAFTAPSPPAASSAAVPLLSLSPTIATTGGILAGGRSLYYAVSAVDATGAEGGLSFIVQATLPSTTNTNQVTLTGFSFSAGATGFRVYRGVNPSQLLLIDVSSSVTGSYTDSGTATELQGPPDPNYDHANFYWRLELQPEEAVTTASATTVANSTLGMLTNDFAGSLVRITRGTGATQERSVVSNTSTTLTVTPAWTVTPDTTSFFTVADSTWNFGGVGSTSPVTIDVPNRPGASVEISGRSANSQNEESAEALNPLTSWQIVGDAGGGVDLGVPPAPTFGLDLVGQGAVELAGIAFSNLTNTHTISAATLFLYYWNELNSPSTVTVAASITATDTTVTLNVAGTSSPGDRIQIETEVLQVVTVTSSTEYQVTRGADGTSAALHNAGAAIYALEASVSIVPFVSGFFGSPASGDYSYSVFVPDVRIASAGLFMTNVYGSGSATLVQFTATTDEGLRTLAGGQLSLQVEGYLAIQTDATPPLVIETTEAVRDIFAVVGQAPSGGAIDLQLRQGSTVYCTLTIADGTTTSASVGGFGLPPLVASSLVSLDILAVPGAADTLPGSDLTVIIRL